MLRAGSQRLHPTGGGFNGHPPLGVNATVVADRRERGALDKFQRAPTLGGECYETDDTDLGFGWYNGFNGHPPLGVNATLIFMPVSVEAREEFQRAPTLGGESYS